VLPIHLSLPERATLESARTLPPVQRQHRIKQKQIPSHLGALLEYNWPTLKQLIPGRYRVTLTLAGADGGTLAQTSRVFEVQAADALKARVRRIARAIEAAKKLADSRWRDGVEHRDVLLAARTAQRFLGLVERRITAGRIDELGKPLTYAEDALRAFPQLALEAEDQKP
jgi:hypothetical protein